MKSILTISFISIILLGAGYYLLVKKTTPVSSALPTTQKNENPMEIISIDPKKLGLFIGNSGQHIKELTTRFDCKIKANQTKFR